jgi:4-amino-4-deoxy-L-arabinose transferase-like glycosyltransferase
VSDATVILSEEEVQLHERAGWKARAARSLLVMMAVGMAVRLIVVAFMYREHLNPVMDHWKFGWEMGRVARSLYLGRGFSSPMYEPSGPTAWMAPVYPLLMAGVFKLFGLYSTASDIALLVLNSVFAVVTTIPVYKTAQRLFGEQIAVMAGWTWALLPYSIYVGAGRIWENSLTTLLAALIYWVMYCAQASGSKRDWALWGVLWGVGALTSPALLAMLPFLVGWAAWRECSAGGRWLLKAILCLAVMFTVISPWTLRNYLVFDRIIPMRDNFWLEMHVGNNGDSSEPCPDKTHPSNSAEEREQFYKLGEIGYMQDKKLQAREYIAEHPVFVARLTLRRVFFIWTGFWSKDPKFLADEPLHLPGVFYSTMITLMSLTGIWLAWRNGVGEWMVPLALAMFSFPLVYYITHPSYDYRHPLDPLMVVMTVYAYVELRNAIPGREPEFEQALESAGD